MNNESRSKPQGTKYRQVWLLRWLGYFIAILVNVIVLVVVNRFPGWQVLPFLTPDLARVLWLFNLSVLVTIVVNALFIIYDPEWFMSLCRMVMNTISLIFAIRLWLIFPFDFSKYSGFDWTLLASMVIIIAIVGISIAILVEFIKFVIALIRQR
jgi:hypothetical protein